MYSVFIDRREATEGNGLTFEQNSVLSCLWNWRDLTARREDESCGYIMSNAELLRIGKAVPSDTQAIIATGPLGEFTREHLEDICSVIQEQLQGGGNQGDRMPMASAGEEAGGGEEESFMLNLSSPAPANKKRSSFEVGMGGTRHQMGRMQGYSTVTEFTPHLSAIPSVSSFHPPEGSDQLLRNDGIGTDPDWKKKVNELINIGMRRHSLHHVPCSYLKRPSGIITLHSQMRRPEWWLRRPSTLL